MTGANASRVPAFDLSSIVASLGDVGQLIVDPVAASIEFSQHVQLEVRVAAVVVHADVWTTLDAHGTRLLVHNLVANLAPRKLRGLTSQGMIVAASLEGGAPRLASFLEDVPIGARLK